MRIAKDFFKHVPIEKQQTVYKKLEQFTTAILDAKIFHDVPKGFWIRKIAGTNIYKFRVNSGDRILFTFNEDQTLTYLSFEVHDTQIKSAKRQNETQFVDLVMSQSPYEDDDQDILVDKYANEELINKLRVVSQEEVIEDEYISLLLDDKQLFETEDIFTLEQFNCLIANKSLSIVQGCAGSGKTNIALRKLKLHEELHVPTVYVTHSQYLMNAAKELYLKKYGVPSQIEFLSWQQLMESVLKKKFTVITRTDFTQWYKQNFTLELDENDVYIEINSVLKGASQEKLLSQQQYLQLPSTMAKQRKKQIYFVATMYESWLSKNQYVDLNDIAYEVLQSSVNAISSIIFDEMQELTSKQLNALLKIMAHPENSMLLGDSFQAIQNSNFQIDHLHTLLKEQQIKRNTHSIYKNFRSGEEVVSFLNYLKDKVIDLEVQREIAIRKTVMPKKIINNDIPKKYIDLINADAEVIVVLATDEDRQKYIDSGLKRVFLISEIQGLQYKKVYCHNVLAYFEKAQRIESHVLKQYLHSVYVAASRTINELYFIESVESNSFQNFEMENTTFETIFANTEISTKERWLEEGKKLELLGNFHQALHAYEQAGELQAVKRCEKLITRKLNFEHVKDYEMVLCFDFYVENAKKIEHVLEILKSEGLVFRGQMMVYRAQENGILTHESFYIDDEISVKEVSEHLFKLNNFSYAKLDSIFICGVLYEDNKPIKIGEKYKQKDNDIIFKNDSGRYQMYLDYLKVHRKMIKEQRKFDQEVYGEASKIIEQNDLSILIEKNEKENAEDFLNNIFGK
ncbi:UvrD-helicase domain-containing protein [Lysinibacillus sp. K60]|uniref:UvrD-helicase domain-containing protein n=1 Tax=Lysinibacillus sp. K60 TaxID=2720027 RepID=UPI001C8C1536|nr:UvrD-helicase domain-containing protein [Lysinibacillus sp. K60]MBX8946812.1 AAA family ATPase [Lysinibacillus sp. K60]